MEAQAIIFIYLVVNNGSTSRTFPIVQSRRIFTLKHSNLIMTSRHSLLKASPGCIQKAKSFSVPISMQAGSGLHILSAHNYSQKATCLAPRSQHQSPWGPREMTKSVDTGLSQTCAICLHPEQKSRLLLKHLHLVTFSPKQSNDPCFNLHNCKRKHKPAFKLIEI